MSFSKKDYKSIQRALHNRAAHVRLNDTWQKIHDELGVGSVSTNKLILTREDYEKIREWASIESGVDPLTTTITGNRFDAASLVRNEKWATESVFSGMIQVNMILGEIPLAHGGATTPPGTLLSVAASDIETDKITSVVLVENGIVARYWHKCCIPEQLSTALMVYRGHASEAEAVKGWLNSLPSKIEKVGYFDFDPAGFGMALDYGLDAILIPDPINDELAIGINNKPEAHIEQMLRRPNLGKQLPKSCSEIWEWMTCNRRKCAITQERLTVIKWHLRKLSLI